jgi:hypothetical protein
MTEQRQIPQGMFRGQIQRRNGLQVFMSHMTPMVGVQVFRQKLIGGDNKKTNFFWEIAP